MRKGASGTGNNRSDLIERDLSRLLSSALSVQVPPLRYNEVCWQTLSTADRARPACAFPAWGLGASAGCLLALAVLGLLAPYSLPVPRTLVVAVPIANLAMAPLAALAVVRRRSLSHAR